MAGEVRQPIDLPSLERYLNQNVPAVKTPLDLKQVNILNMEAGNVRPTSANFLDLK